MTLDEVIAHAEWAANNCEANNCEGRCSEWHHQLAEWLRELRERMCAYVVLEDERNILLERLGDYKGRLDDYREFLRDARAENDKLREAVAYLMGFAGTLGVSHEDLRELFGIEVAEYADKPREVTTDEQR